MMDGILIFASAFLKGILEHPKRLVEDKIIKKIQQIKSAKTK